MSEPSPDTPGPAVLPVDQAGEEAEAPWQRLHPLTPWLRNWAGLLGLGALAVNLASNNLNELMELGRLAGLWRIAGAILGVLLIMAVYNFAWWRKARFRVGSQSVELTRGLLSRQHRRLRLDQLEAIDIVHPLVPRLFGLAELRLETAGGVDSQLSLAYLTGRQAERVRADVLSRRPNSPEAQPHEGLGVTGRQALAEVWQMVDPHGAPTPPAAQDPAGSLPTGGVLPPLAGPGTRLDGPPPVPGLAPVPPGERPLFRVPAAWTLQSYFRTLDPWLTLLIAAAGVVPTVLTVRAGNWGSLVVYLPVLAAFARAVWKHLVTEMGFTGYATGDGVRLTHGLTTQVNQSIPAGRIQAVRLRQRRWWRGPDWCRIDLNVAGYGLVQQSGDDRSLLVPVADPATARLALAAVMPQVTEPAIWSLIDRGLRGTGADEGFVTSPRRARLFSPFAWRRQGYAHTPQALIIRGGWFARQVVIVPHHRIQALSVKAGPWDRRRSIASLTAHSTQGPVLARIPHLDQAAVSALLAVETPLVDRPEPERAAARPCQAGASSSPEPSAGSTIQTTPSSRSTRV